MNFQIFLLIFPKIPRRNRLAEGPNLMRTSLKGLNDAQNHSVATTLPSKHFITFRAVEATMRRFRSRFRGRRRTNFRQARRIVRAVSGTILAKRVILGGVTIPDVTAADWDNPVQIPLAVCQETMDEELESDGTNTAQVPLYSRLVGLKLNLQVVGPSSASVVHRWMLHKLPDGEELITDANRLTNTGFHSSDDTNPFREFRKMQLAKGMLITNSSTGVTPLRIFVKKAAMMRVAPMRENDVIRLDIAKDQTGIASTIHGFGTLYFRANA